MSMFSLASIVEDEKLGLAEGVDKLENKPEELQPQAEDVEKKNEPEEEEDKVLFYFLILK